jgi:hypothetical protein
LGRGSEETAVIPESLVGAVNFDLLLELHVLELYYRILLIAGTVVLGQEGKSLVIATLSHKPTGRLGEEKSGANYNASGGTLKDERKTPRPVGGDATCAEGDTSSRNGTSEPSAVVETGHTTTPLRWANLNTVRGSGGGEDGDTEAEDEATSNELVLRRSRSNNN